MSLLALALGTLLLLAGGYQLADGRVSAFRVFDLDASNSDADRRGRPAERAFSRAVGVALVLTGLFLLWLGQH